MNGHELIQYIFDDHKTAPWAFSRWIETSDAFRAFAERYRDKIRKKVRTARQDPLPEETLKDRLFELEIAHIMLKTGRFSVEYEKYGKKGPDFTTTDKTGVVFNVEVKRIREGQSRQVRFSAWLRYIRQRIFKTPSALALYMKFDEGTNTSLDLVGRLEILTEKIIDYIAGAVQVAEREILDRGAASYSVLVPEFENEFILEFRKPPYSTSTLANDGSEAPRFRTGKEGLKFKDLYWDALGQTIPDMINVLVINTDSETHDSWALRICMYYLDDLVTDNDIPNTRQLGGVLFRGGWVASDLDPNILWCDVGAYCPIPDEIKRVLQRLN